MSSNKHDLHCMKLERVITVEASSTKVKESKGRQTIIATKKKVKKIELTE